MILAVQSRDAGFGDKMRASNATKLGYRSAPPMAFAKPTVAAAAILCWDTLKQAEVYTKAADQRRLDALWIALQRRNQTAILTQANAPII